MQRLAYFLVGKGCGPLKRSEFAPERSMMRVGSRIPLLLAAMIFAVGHVTSASADPLQADACAQKMRNFVRDLDYVMTLEQDTVYPLKSVLEIFSHRGMPGGRSHRIGQALAVLLGCLRAWRAFWNQF
jgi:hypothetical protein